MERNEHSAILLLICGFGALAAASVGLAVTINEYGLASENPKPTPAEVPVDSFENSFNSELQLTPTPQP